MKLNHLCFKMGRFFSNENKGFSVIEVLIVGSMMTIVGLGMSTIITNTSKSQKKLEQKDQQVGNSAYSRSILQNPDFCKNAFCNGSATCGHRTLGNLPTSDAEAAALNAAPIEIFGFQVLGDAAAAASAQSILVCNPVAGQLCNSGANSTGPDFGTPVSGLSGMYVSNMELKNFSYQGTNGGIAMSSADFYVQYVLDSKLSSGGQLRDSVFRMIFKANAATRGIVDCSAGAIDSVWRNTPSAPTKIYYDNLEPSYVGIRVTDPLTPLHIALKPTDVSNGILLSTPASQNLQLISNTAAGDWNGLIQLGDRGIIYSGGAVGNPGGGLVIGPWAAVPSGIRLDAAGNVSVNGQLGVSGNIVGGGGITEINNFNAYVTTSDQTLKHDIVPIDQQTEQLEKLKTYFYRYKNDEKQRLHTGVLAQEIQDVYPHVVYKTDSGKLNVNYPELIPILIKSLQESNERIRILEEKLQSFENVKNQK